MKKIVRFLAVILFLGLMQQDVFAGRFIEKVKGKVETVFKKKELKLPSDSDYNKLVLRGDSSQAEVDLYLNRLPALYYNQLLHALRDFDFALQYENIVEDIYKKGKELGKIVKKIIKNELSNVEGELRRIVTILDKNMEALRNLGAKNSQQQEILKSIEKFKKQLRNNADHLIVFVQKKKRI